MRRNVSALEQNSHNKTEGVCPRLAFLPPEAKRGNEAHTFPPCDLSLWFVPTAPEEEYLPILQVLEVPIIDPRVCAEYMNRPEQGVRFLGCVRFHR